MFQCTLHTLVYRSVKQNPSAVAALTSDGDSLTYGSLWLAATKFSSVLKDVGVSLEDIVGIAVPEGLEFVVSMLSILRAGGAFAPIDLGDLFERQLNCFPMKFVIAFSSDFSRFEHTLGKDVKIINADGLRDMIRSAQSYMTDAGIFDGVLANEEDELGPASERNLAWVHMTSGSTGEPYQERRAIVL